jgi:Uma2 family endonuclease
VIEPRAAWAALESDIATASRPRYAPLSIEAFRNWAASRPDEERWELIDGVPMMMAPPTRDHQRIASNFERLLNDASTYGRRMGGCGTR